MPSHDFKYIIVGGGLAGASAVEGIRKHDPDGSILLVGSEKDLPYHRPPLTKGLWTGKKKVQDIFVHDAKFYSDHHVDVRTGRWMIKLRPDHQTLLDKRGTLYRYEKLLLATGGTPRQLEIPGSQGEGICYYRTLGDYLEMHEQAGADQSALVIGGGFIGSEIAAALAMNQVKTTLLFPGKWPCSRLFPESLGHSIQEKYQSHGVAVLSQDTPVSIRRRNGRFITRTQTARVIESDILIVGIGIEPQTALAAQAGLETGNGIIVNEYLQTSHPNIYAAGDNAFFPQPPLGNTRVEHWDNALNQGRAVGENMAGAQKPYDYMPYFFSDLFDFGYEAVGQIDSLLPTFADWQEENSKGVVYYMQHDRVRGVLLCNVWEKVDAARELIRSQRRVTPDDLRGAIK